MIITFVLLFLGGGLASDVFGWLGLGDTVADVWRIARWPLALLSAMLVYAVVYFAAPNVEIRRFQIITPGAVFGVFTWIVASALFFLYVSNFSSYSATYGAFAAAVILLVWLWLTNVVLLFGAELNAVIDLRRSPELSHAPTAAAPREGARRHPLPARFHFVVPELVVLLRPGLVDVAGAHGLVGALQADRAEVDVAERDGDVEQRRASRARSRLPASRRASGRSSGTAGSGRSSSRSTLSTTTPTQNQTFSPALNLPDGTCSPRAMTAQALANHCRS